MNALLEKPLTTTNTAEQPVVDESASDSNAEMLTPRAADTTSERPTSKPQAGLTPPVTPPCSPAKPLEKGRFAVGLLLSSLGVTLLLFVAVGMLQHAGINGWFSLPLVAVTAIGGVMMLGGGFGLMATAAAGLDDGEFERLMEAGNISSVTSDARSAIADASAAHRKTDDDEAGAAIVEVSASLQKLNDDDAGHDGDSSDS